jgi:hypothetical protein
MVGVAILEINCYAGFGNVVFMSSYLRFNIWKDAGACDGRAGAKAAIEHVPWKKELWRSAPAATAGSVRDELDAKPRGLQKCFK